MNNRWDVIVVGGGGSGLAAALSASQQGANVLVLEKQAQLGGTTGIAVGSFTAAGTSLQRQKGVNDHWQHHVEDVAGFADASIEARNNAPLRSFFLEQAATTFEWIQELGLSFVGPHPEPPNRAPRMHNVIPGAKAYIAAFQLALQKLACRHVCDAEVTELLVHDDRVVGVRATVAGVEQEFSAKQGVILAAGDYSSSQELIGTHKGKAFEVIDGINPHANGGGHLLAQQAGGQLVNMDITYGPELRFVPTSKKPFQQWLPTSGPWARLLGAITRRLPSWCLRYFIKRLLVTWQHPENQLFEDGAILVNQQGVRFVDETAWPERELAVARQESKLAYILLDQRLVKRYSEWPHFISTAPDIAYAYVADYLRLRPDVSRRAATLEELATMCDIPPGALKHTVVEFNQGLSNQDIHGREDTPQPLKDGPWVLLGPVRSYFTTTEGGAAINQDFQVLNHDEQVIPGLYAVGQNGSGGTILWSHGLHIAWALTSGRLAGQAIMRDA